MGVPLLLEFGLHPREAAATSGFLIFFNTSSNVIYYILAGTVDPFLGYAMVCCVVAALGSLLGLALGHTQFVRERSYLLIYLVACLLAGSGVLLAYRGFSYDVDWTFHKFCPT